VIVEVRTYTFHSGQMARYLDAFRRVGFALQREHLGEPVAFLVSETGPIEQVVQIFRYADWTERDRRREALWADPRFTAMSADLHPLIKDKTSQILREIPTSITAK
jgi:hypothetical protein